MKDLLLQLDLYAIVPGYFRVSILYTKLRFSFCLVCLFPLVVRFRPHASCASITPICCKPPHVSFKGNNATQAQETFKDRLDRVIHIAHEGSQCSSFENIPHQEAPTTSRAHRGSSRCVKPRVIFFCFRSRGHDHGKPGKEGGDDS